jgi:Protein of unknown function (DUF3300)
LLSASTRYKYPASPEEDVLGSIVRIVRRRLAASLACIAIGGIALARDTVPIVAPSTILAAPAPSAAASAPAAPATPPVQRLGEAQLDQLVAPIALYPDPLLAQILIASTYPLEVVEAARWVGVPANQPLTGDALTSALATQNWDPSVKALVAFPRVLETMSNQLQWTQALGNAFLAQEADVMGAVQNLRHEAMGAGTLKATPQCDCAIQANGSTVAIPPAEPEDLRVPVYNPAVYGPWPYPDSPPDEFPAPDDVTYLPGSWIGFEPPVDLAFFGPLWGWSWIDWGQRNIAIGPRRHARALGGRAAFSGKVWVHDPAHRGGVRYADAATRARFDAARVAALTMAARAAAAEDATAVVHLGNAVGFAAARNEAAREWAGRVGGVTVFRGGGGGFRGEAAIRRASAWHDGPAFRGAPAFHGTPAFQGGGAPHFAMTAPQGGERGGGPGSHPH